MSETLPAVAGVSAETLEHVLGTGDLSKLTVPQRVEYYRRTCESLGLNPLTRPIRFLTLNGAMQLYFTRDGTDQLRKVNGITLHVVDRVAEAGVYSVTVRARDKHGREDEDIGAVVLPQGGESRANALMKAITKAKRRVTLSICGLGQTDESELDTMPGARVFDAEDEPPVVPIRTVPEPGTRAAINDAVPMKAAAAAMPAAARKVDPTVYAGPDPLDEPDGRRWMDNLTQLLANAQSQDEVVEIAGHASVGNATAKAPEAVKRRLTELLANAYARFAEPDLSDEALGEVEMRSREWRKLPQASAITSLPQGKTLRTKCFPECTRSSTRSGGTRYLSHPSVSRGSVTPRAFRPAFSTTAYC